MCLILVARPTPEVAGSEYSERPSTACLPVHIKLRNVMHENKHWYVLALKCWGHSFLIESKCSWPNHNHGLWTLRYHSWSWLRRRCHFDYNSVFFAKVNLDFPDFTMRRVACFKRRFQRYLCSAEPWMEILWSRCSQRRWYFSNPREMYFPGRFFPRPANRNGIQTL